MDNIDISTPEGADVAMIAIDYAIDKINSFRAELGAVQNRFESTIANLSTTSENLSAANSRLRGGICRTGPNPGAPAGRPVSAGPSERKAAASVAVIAGLNIGLSYITKTAGLEAWLFWFGKWLYRVTLSDYGFASSDLSGTRN